MKKFLLSLIVVFAFIGNVMADDVFTFSSMGYENAAELSDVEIKVGDATIVFSKGSGSTTPKYYNTGTAARIYGGNTMTISSTKTITGIVFTTGTGANAFSDAQTWSVGTFADNEWTGSANEIVCTNTASSGHVRVVSVTVSYNAAPTKTIDAPTITPATGTYTEAQNVTVTAANGYGVIYTLDGSTPDDGNGTYVTEGTATFTVDKTTTVKAISVDNDDPDNCSKVTTATITIIEPAKTMTIVEAHAAAANTNISLEGVTVAAIADAGVVLSDATGILYLYKSNHGLNVGDVVNVSGQIGSYGGFAQMPANSTVEKTGTTTVTYPQAVNMDGAALDAWIAAPVQQYVQYKGQLTISGNYYNIAVEGAQTAIGALVKPYKELANRLVNNSPVTVTGYAMYVSGSKYVYVVATDVFVEGEIKEIAPITLAEFTNGGFEAWTDGSANQWKASTSASNATVEQATDSHNGTYSALVKGSTSNTRLASTEIAVPAGTYTLTVFAKHSGMDEIVSMVRPGYAVATLNELKTGYNSLSSSDYHYLTAAVEVGSEWTEMKNTFVLEEDVILSILVMNQKNSGDVLIDDVELRLATEEEIAAAGINDIISAKTSSAAKYNVAGQKVTNNYHGIVIMNGKKVVF